MAVEAEQDPLEVRDIVLQHLPAVPGTTKKFLLRAAAAASPSVSSGSGRVPTGTVIDSSTSLIDADADILDEVLDGGISRGATAVVSEGDAGSTVTVSGASALEPACVSDAFSSDAAESSGMAFPEFRARAPIALSETAVSALFRHLPLGDVFRIGFLFSRNWLQVWQRIPLVLHDVQLASRNDREIMLSGQRISFNLAKKISRILDLHPGPVELFRVDSTSWQEGNNHQWRVWIHKLINKNTKEIIVCGRWPRSLIEFLPNNLTHCSSLRTIHICFFSVPRIADNLSFPHLKELGLFHCVFENDDLDCILRNCKLSNLDLGYVKLAILKIQSETLRSLTMWNCNFEILCLSGTPNLVLFLQEPSFNFYHRSHLQLRGIPKLKVISTVFLNQLTIELCGYRIKADMIDYPLCWSVTRLELVVNFSSENDLALIPALLNCFPKLEILIISRFDSHESYTGAPIDWQRMLSTVLCIKKSLIKFELSFCLDDGIENDLANAILAFATKLKDFQFNLHPSLL